MSLEKDNKTVDNLSFQELINKRMQSPFYNKNSPSSPNLVLSEKNTPLVGPLDDEEFSNNILNTGFIAEDSKLNLSDSSSVFSQGVSMSAVSAIHGNPKNSANFISNIHEEIGTISGMEEWPSPQPPFAKKNFKRTKPEMIEDQLEELAHRCTKKKMGDRNKVVTINPHSKGFSQKGYRLRSKGKMGLDEDSSSNDDIREMLRDIGESQKGANGQKSKMNSK